MTASALASASAATMAAARNEEESHVGNRVNRKKNNTRLVTRVATVRTASSSSSRFFFAISFASRLAQRPFASSREGGIGGDEKVRRWKEKRDSVRVATNFLFSTYQFGQLSRCVSIEMTTTMMMAKMMMMMHNC